MCFNFYTSLFGVYTICEQLYTLVIIYQYVPTHALIYSFTLVSLLITIVSEYV